MAKKILIVDDDPEDLNTTELILKKEGYEVATASNGATALDKLAAKKHDLILIDVQMPTLSGYDLLRLLRERLNHSIPMVYITIVPQKDVDMHNIDGFIQKPFTPKTLMDEVKKILKK